MIEIVRIKPKNLEVLAGFFNEVNIPEYTRDFSPHPFNAGNAARVCNYTGRDLYYAVLIDGRKMIGYGMLRGWDEGYEIPSVGLCVLKKYHGIGLGKLLLNFLETVAGLSGCSKVMLKVKKNNKVARKLYDSQKYVFKEYNQDFIIGHKDLKGERK